ncbi:MAG: transcriptional repressor LexA [Candidatus Omnitrophota bacterium]
MLVAPKGHMENPLTEKQKRVLRFIAQRIWREKNVPTIREIAKAFKFSSTGTVRDYLRALQQKGYIKLTRKKSRAIELNAQKLLNIPIIGHISAGHPTLAYEDIEGYLNLERVFFQDEHIFALRVKGDSMVDAGIMSDDLVLVRRQLLCASGDIVVALIGGEATVKYYRTRKDKAYLEPANKKYTPIAIQDDFSVIGKVISVVRRYV